MRQETGESIYSRAQRRERMGDKLHTLVYPSSSCASHSPRDRSSSCSCSRDSTSSPLLCSRAW